MPWEGNLAYPALFFVLMLFNNFYFSKCRFNGTSVVDIVENYNLETDKWRVGPPLSSSRSGHASAVFCSPLFCTYDLLLMLLIESLNFSMHRSNHMVFA